MGQSYDRPSGGQGAGLLPRPTPPPRKMADEATNQEPASRLPPVSAPPRKIGQVPEMSVFNGLASKSVPLPPKSTLSGGFGPLPAPSMPGARASLPAVAPPPRRSADMLSESITKIRSDAPQPADTIRNGVHDAPTLDNPEGVIEADGLDWEEDEESTHVFGNGSAPPPANEAPAQARAREVPPPSSSILRSSIPNARASSPPSSRAPRLVPPSPPSKATLLGVYPSELTGPSRPAPAWPPPSNGGVVMQHEMGEEQATVPREQNGYEPNGHGAETAGGAPRSFGAQNGYGSGPPAFPPPAFPAPAFPPLSYAQQQQQEDVGFVRLPSARAGSPTELGLRRPVLPIMAEVSTSGERSSKRMALVIAVATALVTAAAASAFLLIRRPGTLQVEVRDPKGATVAVAEVFVDGKKVCESTPCIVRDLEAGPRAVRVVANGFANEEPTTVDVGSGTITTLPVALKGALGGLIAASDQPGLRIFVDGNERGPLPARLTDISPGTHQIRIAGGERYKPLERSIETKAGEPIDLGSVRLSVLRGKMTVALKTEGASIVLIPNDDASKAKVLDGPFPRAIEVETASGTWKLVAKKKGLPDFVAPLDFSDGVAERTLEVVLKDKDKAETAPAPAPVPGPAPNTPPVSPPTKPEPVAKPEPKPTAEEPTDKGSGFLNINSLPVSRILLDGQPMGETPKTGVKVSAGTHTITFVHPDLPKKSVSVTVKAGETKTASAKLRD